MFQLSELTVYCIAQAIHDQVRGEVPAEATLDPAEVYNGVEDDDWWDEFWNTMVEDDDEAPIMFGMYDDWWVHVSLPADQVPHPRLSKRRRTTRYGGDIQLCTFVS
jgi:hypothetical protein